MSNDYYYPPHSNCHQKLNLSVIKGRNNIVMLSLSKHLRQTAILRLCRKIKPNNMANEIVGSSSR